MDRGSRGASTRSAETERRGRRGGMPDEQIAALRDGAAPRRARIPGLDGLRGVAVLLVIAYHVAPVGVPGGYLGVDVFFVLSGYLITSMLLREVLSTGRIDLRSFYGRRVRRLAPALVTLLPVVSGIALLLGGDLVWGLPVAILGGMTFTSNWVQIFFGGSYMAGGTTGVLDNLWSLAVEEQFYLLWPVVMLSLGALGAVSRQRRMAVIAAAAMAVTLALWAAGFSDFAYLSTVGHAGGLLCGALVAVGLDTSARTAPSFRGLRSLRRPPVAGAVIVAGVAGLVLLTLAEWTGLPGMRPLWTLVATVISAAVVAACAAAGTQGPTPLAGKVLDCPPLRWMGERSYSAYLWHLPLIVIIDAVVTPLPEFGRTPGRLLAVALTLLIAHLSWTLLERPFLERRKVLTVRGLLVVLAGAVSLLITTALAVTAVLDPSRYAAEPVTDAWATEQVEDPASARTDEPTTERSEPAPSAAPALEPPTGNEMLAVGDSVMLASEKALKHRFPGISVDAEENRQLTQGDDIVAQHVAEDPEVEVIIVGLGINGIGDSADLEDIVRAAGDREVIFVSTHGPVTWVDDVNSSISDVAYAHPDEVAVARWDDAASQNPQLLARDGVHPGHQGAQLYAECIDVALDDLYGEPSQG